MSDSNEPNDVSIPTVPLNAPRFDEATMRTRAAALFARLETRRSVRDFSAEPVPLDVVRTVVHAAAQAPSGANKQPWTFVLVTDPAIKAQIRAAAEAEEQAFYDGRAPAPWLADLEPLGTDWRKPFLETAPALIVVFAQSTDLDGAKHYYVKESVGIACGNLIAGLHEVGLATLTHTPSPMGFLARILNRPANEKAFLLLPVGYPTADCEVPAIERKPLQDVLIEV